MYLDLVKNSLTDRIEISSQNSWVGKGGAFTGEIRLVYSLFWENRLRLFFFFFLIEKKHASDLVATYFL